MKITEDHYSTSTNALLIMTLQYLEMGAFEIMTPICI